jgi:hypothetical protein
MVAAMSPHIAPAAQAANPAARRAAEQGDGLLEKSAS